MTGGAAYFDINGKWFVNTRNPEKVTECNNRCAPKWERLEDLRVVSDWTDFQPEAQPSSAELVCFKWQRRLIVHREQNSCTKEIRDAGEPWYETRKVEIPCPCTKYSRLRLVADPDDPSHGQSFFDYHLFRVVGSEDAIPGLAFSNPDSQIPPFPEKLAKGTVVLVNVPEDGSSYYAFYDAEIGNRKHAQATCPVGVTAAWDLKLTFECGCTPYQP